MSRVTSKSPKATTLRSKPSVHTNRTAPAGMLSMAILATSMLFLPGCGYFQNRQHIEVGSIPDDYRTNHPINIAEQEQHLDVPVGSSDNGLTIAQRSVIEGFVTSYRNSGSGPVQLSIPSRGANAAAARRVAPEISAALRKAGVPAGMVVTTTYDSPSDATSPVRVSYRAVTASTGQCGKWPDDIANTSENKHYADFGCSYQNNFAAQLANPADLLGPRGSTEIDAAKRQKVIEDYQSRGPSTTSEVDY